MSRTLKVLHLPVAFLPWTTGGREVYTHSLAHELQKQGVDNHIAIHQNPGVDEPPGHHSYNGLPVTVLHQIPAYFNAASRYTRVFKELPGFEEYVKNLKPDVVHFHDQNGGASLSHLRVVRRLGIRTVVTYHSPGQSCSQTELLFRGKTICDGQLLVGRCTSCRLSIAGVPAPVSDVLARIPMPGSAVLDRSDRVSRMLSARTKTKLFIESFYEFMNSVDRVHVHARWVEELIVRNKIERTRLFFAATAATSEQIPLQLRRYSKGQVIELAFIGRCTQIKGVHVLIDAIKLLEPNIPLKVSFFGPYWDDAFGRAMLEKIKDDSRFNQPELVPNDQLPGRLAQMDAAVIPSTWPETGPLTFFDAQCAGLPVIGSRLGGLTELVVDNKNGLLFDAGNSRELSAILARLAANPEELNRLRQGIGTVRPFSALATDLLALYHSIVID